MTITSMTIKTSLKKWLAYVLRDLNLYTLEGWAAVLGVTPRAVEMWIIGRECPPASRLRGILLLLKERYPNNAKDAIEAWASLSKLAPAGAWGQALGEGATQAQQAQTLAHYILTPLHEDLRVALGALPAEKQDQLLSGFVAAALAAGRKPK